MSSEFFVVPLVDDLKASVRCPGKIVAGHLLFVHYLLEPKQRKGST